MSFAEAAGRGAGNGNGRAASGNGRGKAIKAEKTADPPLVDTLRDADEDARDGPPCSAHQRDAHCHWSVRRWGGANGWPDDGRNGYTDCDPGRGGHGDVSSDAHFGTQRDGDVSRQPDAIRTDGHLRPRRASRWQRRLLVRARVGHRRLRRTPSST